MSGFLLRNFPNIHTKFISQCQKVRHFVDNHATDDTRI